MTQAGPSNALQHRSRRERQQLQRRADMMSTLLIAALVIGLHAAWFSWQTQGASAASAVTSSTPARHHATPGTASF